MCRRSSASRRIRRTPRRTPQIHPHLYCHEPTRMVGKSQQPEPTHEDERSSSGTEAGKTTNSRPDIFLSGGEDDENQASTASAVLWSLQIALMEECIQTGNSERANTALSLN